MTKDEILSEIYFLNLKDMLTLYDQLHEMVMNRVASLKDKEREEKAVIRAVEKIAKNASKGKDDDYAFICNLCEEPEKEVRQYAVL